MADSIGVTGGKVTSFINACGDNPVSFNSSATGGTAINFEWLINKPDGSIFFEGSAAQLDELDLSFPDQGDYQGYLAVDDGSECQDTAFFTVSRKRGATSEFELGIDSCFLGPINYSSLAFADPGTDLIDLSWDINGEYTTNEENFDYQFAERGLKSISLVSINNLGCSDTLTQEILYDPPHDEPGVIAIDTVLCYGDSIQFQNQWIKTGGYYEDILEHQSTGCDSIGRSLNLSYAPQEQYTDLDTAICLGESVTYYGMDYSTTGDFQHSTYSVLTGCDSIIHNISLDVQELPTITIVDKNIVTSAFQDLVMPVSITGDYESITWTPAVGLDCNNCALPTINSDLDTTYAVEVLTSAGCVSRDSLFVDFVFVPEKYFFPTILSIDGQGSDENFLYLQTTDMALNSVNYDLQVYDRWGGLMYDGKDLTINNKSMGWSSRAHKPGVYLYRFTIKEHFDTKIELGSITVID